MLQVARLAPTMLGEAAPRVAEFFRSQQRPDGGFADRGGDSDLYYTVFALEGLLALQQPLPIDAVRNYAASFGPGSDLDLVHLACLARCWSILPTAMQSDCPQDTLVAKLEACRSADGGYAWQPGEANGSLYNTFMVVGAYQDLRLPLPEPDRLRDFVLGLRDPLAGFRQSRDLPGALVPMTAGAVALLRQLGAPPTDPALRDWVLSCFDPQGGFRAAPAVPIPDLLSTATALHTLISWKIDLGPIRERCLDFVDSLWTNRGGFYGHWEDTHVDCEYTYYALLSLGHLSL